MAPPDIDGYTIERALGRGGFASVHLARRDLDGAPVAVKVLHHHVADTDARTRFERERLSMSALGAHPNIVDVLDGGITADGDHYLVLEYVAGGSVRDRLAADGAIPWREAVRIGIQMCSALDAAHRIGVLHRDVKPANIFVDHSGAKLGDFGIARLVGSSDVTAAESIIGTLAYTPPEILGSGSFDGRGDIYQLGITLYEMLLGRAPFKSGSADSKAVVLRRILEDPAPPLAQFDIPAALSDLLDEVLAKDPADRPQTAAEFGRRLAEIEARLVAPPTIEAPYPDDPTARLARPTPPPPTTPCDAAAAQPPMATGGSLATGRPEAGQGSPWVRSTRRRRWPLLLALAVISGGVSAALITASLDDRTSDPGGGGTATPPPRVVPIDQTAFAAPEGSDGVVFAAVANSAGLTAVGGAGIGENVGAQSGVVWTMGEDRSWVHQQGFARGVSAEQQRLRGVGVIDGVRLLGVGEAATGPSLDGVAWLGLTVSRMRPVSHPSFIGPGRQTLQSAGGDPAREQFVVVGERAGPDDSVPGLWTLEAGEDWFDPVWTEVDLGITSPGQLSDVAIVGDTAVAVGYLRQDATDRGIALIRRDERWVPLFEPIDDVRLAAVAILGDRIVGVGERRRGGMVEPIAVVSDSDGDGFLHRLPAIGVAGRAHDVVATPTAAVAVGIVGESATAELGTRETDGAMWRLVTAEDANGDLWAPVFTDDVAVEGFQEFWSVVEFDDTFYVLGRAEEATGRRPAAGWTVDGSELGSAFGGSS